MGNFLTFLATNLLTKVAKYFATFWVIFQNNTFKITTNVDTLGQRLEKLGYFLFILVTLFAPFMEQREQGDQMAN